LVSSRLGLNQADKFCLALISGLHEFAPLAALHQRSHTPSTCHAAGVGHLLTANRPESLRPDSLTHSKVFQAPAELNRLLETPAQTLQHQIALTAFWRIVLAAMTPTAVCSPRSGPDDLPEAPTASWLSVIDVPSTASADATPQADRRTADCLR